MGFYDQLTVETWPERTSLMAAPAISRLLRGTTDRALYDAFLAEQFHLLRHALPLLEAAMGRLPRRLDWLRVELLRYVDEESGRAERILGDMRSAGGDPAAARSALPAPFTMALIDWLGALAASDEPVGICGILYVLDATSLTLGVSAADRIQERLDLPDSAFTFLRSAECVHREHLRYIQGLLDRLENAGDRLAVARCAATMYRLLGEMVRHLGDELPATRAPAEARRGPRDGVRAAAPRRPRASARPGGTALNTPPARR